MKLMVEVLEQHLTYLVEGTGEKRHYLEGIFAQAGVANKNKRVYPLPVLQNEITRFTKENISKNRAYGELGHPTGPNINLDRVAMHIKSFRQEGNDFIGKGLITSTPMGNIVKGLLSDGANLGVSTRALGSLKPMKDGLNEVQSDLRLLAVDIVSDPSAPGAYVQGIMENVDYWYDSTNGTIALEQVDRDREAIKKMSTKEIVEEQTRMFGEFLNKLGNYY